jgi:hypothetical protein
VDPYYKPTEIRLDLSPDPTFTRRFGKRVKALGGSYDHVRGYANRRHVHMPFETSEQRDLVDAMLQTYPMGGWRKKGTTVVFGCAQRTYPQSWMKVFEVPLNSTEPLKDAARSFCKTYDNAIQRKIIDPVGLRRREKEAECQKLQAQRQLDDFRARCEAATTLVEFSALASEIESESFCWDQRAEILKALRNLHKVH